MPSQVSLIFWQSLAIFLLIGALTGVAVSLLLIFRPQHMARLNRLSSRWISTRRMNHWLDRSMQIDHWFYRQHRALGMLAVMGACYILAYFGLLFDKASVLQYLHGHPGGRLLLEVLLDALVLTALMGGTAALFVGLFLWLRPSMLRGLEDYTNRWISMRRLTRKLDIPNDQVEQFVAAHAQRVGWILLLGSVYLFFAMFRWLVHL